MSDTDVVGFILDAMTSLKKTAINANTPISSAFMGWDNAFMRAALRVKLWQCFGADDSVFSALESACKRRHFALPHVVGILNTLINTPKVDTQPVVEAPGMQDSIDYEERIADLIVRALDVTYAKNNVPVPDDTTWDSPLIELAMRIILDRVLDVGEACYDRLKMSCESRGYPPTHAIGMINSVSQFVDNSMAMQPGDSEDKGLE